VFHVKHEGSPGGLPVEAASLLKRYEELLRDYAVPRGFISQSDSEDLWERHIADGLRALPLLRPTDRRAVDIGSGAGLPGVPIAVAAPTVEVVLAETRRARIAFLELLVDELPLPNASVHAGMAEDLPSVFDIAFARGFGDAGTSWHAASAVLAEEGRLLYWAGASFDSASDAPQHARVHLQEHPGLESGGPIVIMTRQ
jgi:16S rRNA (guanine527-N7)-methyltransferase